MDKGPSNTEFKYKALLTVQTISILLLIVAITVPGNQFFSTLGDIIFDASIEWVYFKGDDGSRRSEFNFGLWAMTSGSNVVDISEAEFLFVETKYLTWIGVILITATILSVGSFLALSFDRPEVSLRATVACLLLYMGVSTLASMFLMDTQNTINDSLDYTDVNVDIGYGISFYIYNVAIASGIVQLIMLFIWSRRETSGCCATLFGYSSPDDRTKDTPKRAPITKVEVR